MVQKAEERFLATNPYATLSSPPGPPMEPETRPSQGKGGVSFPILNGEVTTQWLCCLKSYSHHSK